MTLLRSTLGQYRFRESAVAEKPRSKILPSLRADDELASPSTPPVSIVPPDGHPRFPLIDGLRGLAAVSIVLLHSRGSLGDGSWWVPFWLNLTWGVAVFFVISGFLLYRPFAAATLGHGPAVGAADFYRRRVLRIVPGYWLALTVLTLLFSIPQVFGHHWWQFYGLLQGYDAKILESGLVVTWSLSIEAGLYLVLPVYAALSHRARGRFPLPLQAAGLTLALAASTLAAHQSTPGHISAQAVVLQGATWFALGMTLAGLSAAGAPGAVVRSALAVLRSPERCWLLAIVLFLLGGVVRAVSTSAYGSPAWLFVLEGLAAALVALPAMMRTPPGRGVVRFVLGNRLVVWLGVISYGLYIWHDQLIYQFRGAGHHQAMLTAAAATLLAWGATVAVAAGSFYLVELPIMSAGRRRSRARSVRPLAERAGAGVTPRR